MKGAVLEYTDVRDISQFVEEATDGDMWPLCDCVVFGAGKIVLVTLSTVPVVAVVIEKLLFGVSQCFDSL